MQSIQCLDRERPCRPVSQASRYLCGNQHGTISASRTRSRVEEANGHALPTIMAPMWTLNTLPNASVSIGTIILTFSPYTSTALRIAMGFTLYVHQRQQANSDRCQGQSTDGAPRYTHV